jgi:hypothetical protein
MATVAPWLIPTDVIRSASAGANVGLTARARDLQAAAQRQAAAEFAAKLNQQAYQFSAEQDLAAQRLAAAQDEHAARLAAELRQQDALDAYRQGELKVRNKEAETHAARLLKANFEPRTVEVGGKQLWQVEPNRYMFPPSSGATTRTPLDVVASQKLLSNDIQEKTMRLRKAQEGAELGEKAAAAELPQLQSALDVLKANYVKNSTNWMSVPSTNAPVATTQPSPLPASKSELVSGQTYITSRGPAVWNGTAFEQR